jgi:hypothetical protein
MFTNVQIINLGLSKIASSRVSRIDPPVSPLERFVAEGYDHWKRSELTKRRWVFATEDDYTLTRTETLENVDRPYKFQLPVECLRPVRGKRTEWKQRRRFLYSAYDTLRVSMIMNVDETEFDPLFVEVLACRIALESVEYVTQSNTKKADSEALYRAAVDEAARANAFVIGPEDIGEDDSDFPFITSRF